MSSAAMATSCISCAFHTGGGKTGRKRSPRPAWAAKANGRPTKAQSEKESKWSPPWPTLLLLACVGLYWNSLRCGFVFDDVTAVRDNRDLRPHMPVSNLFRNDFWGTPMSKERSHKSYRPLTVLTFRWNYLLHELDPAGYHLVNVVLHGLVTLLYYRLASRLLLGGLGSRNRVALFAAALFAAHPVSKEIP